VQKVIVVIKLPSRDIKVIVLSGARAKRTCATFRRVYVATYCLLTKQTVIVPFGSCSSMAKVWQLGFLQVHSKGKKRRIEEEQE